jgi:hypothetical protein
MVNTMWAAGFALHNTRNKSVAVLKTLATNSGEELAAILHAIQSTSKNIILNFHLKYKNLIWKLTTHVASSELASWAGDKDKTL